MSKPRKLFLDEPSNSALQVYQPLDLEEPSSSTLQVYQPLERSIVPSFPKFGIALEELLVLSWDKIFPYVNTQRLKTDGIVKISSGIFQPTRQVIARHEHEPLLLEARNAFTNIRAEWDNEKGELVCEREALKEELNKAKEMVVEVKEMATEIEQRMEVIRLEKEAL
ncbi:hypothetical protein R1flu_009343 [Riccia fluitans]|uniref:Uncharacterized protein n=1 Tax=Riccia fluitans TaxID=41844 RepID=A0ABD1Z1U4_9MARC